MHSFAVSIVQEDDWFVVRCPELDVTSQGRTVAEAEKNIREVIRLYMESFGPEDFPETPVKPLWTTVEV